MNQNLRLFLICFLATLSAFIVVYIIAGALGVMF